MKFLTALFLLLALPVFGAVPAYTSFRGTGGILITSNPPTGNITIDGSAIFTSSGTNATIAISTNGVLVVVAATNVNFIKGTNVVITATNIGSTAHIGIHGMTAEQVTDIVSVFLLTYILPVLTIDTLTVSNLLVAPPNASVQYNSNGIMRGSSGFIYTNGQVRVADIVVAGQGVEITAGSLVLNGGDTALVAWNGLGRMRWPTGGVARLEDDAALSFNRLQLGGDTAAFPAIGRTNGDVIILGANGAFKAGDATNKLRAPAVFIANDSGMGTPLLRLENPLNGIGWDLAINSNPETFLLGLGLIDQNYAMVWELTSGNVGIGITNPTVRLDVQGRFMARSNVYFPNISSNALPVALLATDSDGQVYETAITSGGGGGAGSFAVNPNQFITNSVLNFKDGALVTNLVVKAAEGASTALTVDTNVFVVTAGKVGIGTASPSYPLDVQAATGLQRITSTTAANEATLSFVNNGAALIGLESSVAATTVSGSSAYSLLLANQYAYPVQLATDNSVRMTILPTSGNVGISTVSPTNTLHVQGHTSLSSNVFLPNLPTNGSPIAVLAVDAAGAVYETAVPTGGGSTVAPPISSVQFNSNGVMQGSSGFVYTNGQVDIVNSQNAATSARVQNTSTGTGAAARFLSEVAGNVSTAFGTLGQNYVTSGAFTANTGYIFNNSGGVSIIGSSGPLRFAAGGVDADMTISTAHNVGVGTNAPLVKLDVVGGIRSHTVTASRMAAFHTDKTLTNGATTVALLDNFFAMGITNIVAADSGLVIRTNAGVLTISNTVAAAGGTTPPGNSNQIPFLNVAGTAYMYAGYSSITNPGFGFSPSGPQAGYGGLKVFANDSHGLVTIGHPNPASDLSTFATAFAVSNRYNGTGFKQEMSKYDAVDVGSGSDPSSTFVTYRTWSGSTPTIAAEVRKDGMGFFSHGSMYQSNSLASTMPTATELGPGGYWVGVSNNSLVTVYSLNGSSTAMKILAP